MHSGVPSVLAPETPVALVYNGISHAVMMACPADLEDFAVGFSFSEGLIKATTDILSIDTVAHPFGIELHIQVSARCEQALKRQRRSLAGRTGCGICGTESLQQLTRSPQPVTRTLTLDFDCIEAAVSGLQQWREPGEHVSGLHRVAWCEASQGDIVWVRQDVGRHNALDKLGGAMLRSAFPRTNGFLMLSSRASYELIYKAAALNIELVVAVSAATQLAVAMAQDAGITLIAQARNPQPMVLSFPERLKTVH